MSEGHTLDGPVPPSPLGRGPLARELLGLRCQQLDAASLEEVIAYDRAASAAAEARLHADAAQVGDPAPQLPTPRLAAEPSPGPLPPESPAAPERLLLTWYLSGRSAFCRAALLALAAELARSDGRTAVVALTPEPPEIARRTSADLALLFPAVHDDGRTAEEFGIRYAAPLEFAELLGLATADPSPGSSEAQPPEPRGVLLPLPAMFLMEAGRIRARFVHPDSRYRGEPTEFL